VKFDAAEDIRHAPMLPEKVRQAMHEASSRAA